MRRTLLIIASLLALVILLVGVVLVINGQSQTRPGPTPHAGASASPIATPTGGGVAAGATASPAAGAGPSVVAGANGALPAQPGDTTIQLSWNAVPGASGYLVYRDGAADPLDTAPTTDTKYLDLGLTNGRNYSYIVTAVDQAGQPRGRLGPTSAVPVSK